MELFELAPTVYTFLNYLTDVNNTYIDQCVGVGLYIYLICVDACHGNLFFSVNMSVFRI